MKNLFYCVAILSSLFGIIPAAQAQYAATCTRAYNSSVNLRSGPSRSNGVIASIPPGQYVGLSAWVYGGDGMRWYRVQLGGLVGWIRSDYLCN